VATERGVWIVTQNLIESNPISGVFATRDEATEYLDEVASRFPEATVECAHFVIGERSL
jgi:hypothetical protein